MSAWAKPGVKCVCIKGGQLNSRGMTLVGSMPQVQNVYTITEVRYCSRCGVLLVLAEFPDVGNGNGWEATHFRPLITKTQEQDVGLFVHHLDRLEVEA